MKQTCVRLVLAAFALACVTTSAFAQGGSTSSITGIVIDKDGGGVPGANVSAKNEATSETANTVTTSTGNFTIPAVAVGTYTVTVTLQGFKTAVNKGVIVTGGAPGNVRVVLEVGGISDTVVVLGATERIQTQSSAASTTLNTKQIGSLPLGSRNTLDFVTFLPGVQTPGGSRDSIVNGLPQSTIAITLDGISIQDNHLKTDDGFFARMSPRLDAVEEVTVTTAAQSADSAAQGSTQIKFTTRSGSNTYTGSVYEYYQSDKLNTNTFFNKINKLPKNTITQHQPGVRAGGPLVIPGLYDGHNKAFFFVNYEELHQPASRTDNRTILQADAQNGIFRWANGPAEGVNLYTLAAANGFTSTPDPLVGQLLQTIRASTTKTGTIQPLTGNLNAERFSFQQPVSNINTYPTLRGDYNISARHRFTASFNKNHILSDPDTTNSVQPTFPGFPVHGEQNSLRWTWSTNVRSNLGKNLVNDFHWGGSGGPTQFSPSLVPSMFTDPAAQQNGYALGISAALGITNAYPSSATSSRQASTRVLEDSVNWLRGAHSIAFGGGLTQVNVWLLNDVIAPGISFGLPDGDLAQNMFVAANFPGASSTDRSNAQNLYSVLTGHISQITGTAGLDAATGKYVYNGERRQEGRLNEGDFYVQDNWRVRPNLSMNLGLRYVVQMPFVALNGSYSTVSLDDLWGYSGYVPTCDFEHINKTDCNLFKPGARVGAVPTYQNLGKGVKAYNGDFNNYAPSLGVNWTPGSTGSGFLRRILGPQGTTSFSGGWSRAFERHGMSDFTGVFGGNPGLTQNADRNTTKLNLGPLPLLLRSGDLSGPPSCTGTNTTANSGCVPVAPEYPIPSTITSSVNRFDPDLQVPYADTYTIGLQRLIGKRSAMEVRYIGTRNWQEWSTRNINEVNITENGFLDEYKIAQKNLRASIDAGCGGTGQPACTFAYRGPGTGTSPLPIYLAYFSGVPTAQAGDQTKYTSASFTSTNFTDALGLINGNPRTPAGTNSNTGLRGNATRLANALAAGIPANFFIANPDVSSSNVTTNQSKTKYNSVQFQFRRRLSQGLQFDTNYVMGKAYATSFFSFLVDRVYLRNTGSEGDVTHAFKATWIYELPFGQGRRFGSGIGSALDRLIGGWSITGTARIQSGTLVDLGNVRLVGMSKKEAESAFKFYRTGDLFYAWPQDIMDNTIKAFAVSATTKTGYANDNVPTGKYFAPANNADCVEKISGYGDCGVRSLVVTGPMYRTADMTFAKRVPISGRTNAEIRFDVLNIFQAVNFAPGSGIGSSTLSGYQTTGTNGASSRTTQIQLRFNW